MFYAITFVELYFPFKVCPDSYLKIIVFYYKITRLFRK